MKRARVGRRSGAFTLVELQIVIIVIAILAGVIVPKFINAGERGRESALKVDITLVSGAVQVFYNDTGVFPATLNDLTAIAAPTAGLDSGGNVRSISASSYHGPYLQSATIDPVSGVDFNYGSAYPYVGTVWSSAAGDDLDGVPFSSYTY